MHQKQAQTLNSYVNFIKIQGAQIDATEPIQSRIQKVRQSLKSGEGERDYEKVVKDEENGQENIYPAGIHMKSKKERQQKKEVPDDFSSNEDIPMASARHSVRIEAQKQKPSLVKHSFSKPENPIEVQQLGKNMQVFNTNKENLDINQLQISQVVPQICVRKTPVIQKPKSIPIAQNAAVNQQIEAQEPLQENIIMVKKPPKAKQAKISESVIQLSKKASKVDSKIAMDSKSKQEKQILLSQYESKPAIEQEDSDEFDQMRSVKLQLQEQSKKAADVDALDILNQQLESKSAIKLPAQESQVPVPVPISPDQQREIEELKKQIQELKQNPLDISKMIDQKLQQHVSTIKSEFESQIKQATPNPFTINKNADISQRPADISAIPHVGAVETPMMMKVEDAVEQLSKLVPGWSPDDGVLNKPLRIVQEESVQNVSLVPNQSIVAKGQAFLSQPNAGKTQEQIMMEKREEMRKKEQEKQTQLQIQKNKQLNDECEDLEKLLNSLNNECEVIEADNANQVEMEQNAKAQLQQLQYQFEIIKQRDGEAADKRLALHKLQFTRSQIQETQAEFDQISTNRRRMHNQIEDLKGNIRVLVRVRPMTKVEQQSNMEFKERLKFVDDNTLTFDQSGSQPQPYKFFRVYNEGASQQQVFNDVKPLIQSALDGYNIFVGGYGNTGSGKTFTILGDDGDSECVDKNAFGRLGVLPRSVVELFKCLREANRPYEIHLAMVELYCDQLIDLFGQDDQDLSIRSDSSQHSDSNSQNIYARLPLQVKKTDQGDTYIKNLSWVPARNPEETINYLGQGLGKRHVAATKLNDASSRSHTIIYIKIKQNISTSTIIFADLAGSERTDKTESTGMRFKEAQYINQSLAALGDVMCALSTKKQFVPYRNNKLTMLLQPGMGGNSKSALFINVSPLVNCLGETFCSLQFGVRTRAVENRGVRKEKAE